MDGVDELLQQVPRGLPIRPDKPHLRGLPDEGEGGTIDAADLLTAQDPMQELLRRKIGPMAQVRATAEQILLLEQKMGRARFRMCFGNGVHPGIAQILEIDRQAPAESPAGAPE